MSRYKIIIDIAHHIFQLLLERLMSDFRPKFLILVIINSKLCPTYIKKTIIRKIKMSINSPNLSTYFEDVNVSRY